MQYQNRKNWKYSIYSDCEINLYHDFGSIAHPFFQIKDNVLSVKEGYTFDGASGPTLDTENFMVPSLVHDILFQAMRMGLISHSKFDNANIELKMQCRERGMSYFRAGYVYLGVKYFGKSSIKSDIIEVD